MVVIFILQQQKSGHLQIAALEFSMGRACTCEHTCLCRSHDLRVALLRAYT